MACGVNLLFLSSFHYGLITLLQCAEHHDPWSMRFNVNMIQVSQMKMFS